MESKKIEQNARHEASPKNGERKVLVVEGDLYGLGISAKDLELILRKLNQLHLEGGIQTIEEAREIAPTLDIAELRGEKKEERPKSPRHTKKKGERY